MSSISVENVSLCFQRPSVPVSGGTTVIAVSSLPTQDLPPNHVLIKVERFGFSANNITYQALGEQPHFRYFDFHYAPEAGNVSAKSHGLVPVWGFGTIVASSHPKISPGEHVYGYFAPSRYLLVPVSPSDVNRHAFYVPRPHLPADRRPYNQIRRCAADPEYTPTALGEDLTMLYRPLFWTAYWFEDWLHSTGYRGATRVLLSSASAKTAFCVAYLIRKRRARGETSSSLKIVGLTSARNLAFTRGLGLYDEVVEYGAAEAALAQAPGQNKWVYADVAGNVALNARLFAHLGKALVASIALGMASLEPASKQAAALDFQTNKFTGAEPPATAQLETFFMVEWLSVRQRQLAPDEIVRRQRQVWTELMADCVPWVRLVHVSGANEVKRAYDEITKTGFSADVGYIWSMWDDARPAKM
ncbi:hypothetical protein GGX14DRAFT_586804 [Mycena pura]|uniref:DUF2855 family protein n=1 Tax=Mycena pura TaxID=153505 RepID=A0AAD6V0C4_9AGAR|nr:hypothetical protein GGX14DRAFT_586804 [Mycena pura]